jgi:chromosome segregation ATPase
MSAEQEELAKNFEAIWIKYTELNQQLESEKHTQGQLQREIERRGKQLEDASTEILRLKKDLEEAGQLKDRYFATSIAMEHLKGRLESARKGLVDRDAEHQHEVEQLRSQIADLLRRVESTSDAPLINALRTQKGEMEERCALATGQLLEERERSHQQLMTASAALRDAQSRLVELEQRCRSFEGEIASVRQQARQAGVVANEATAEKERILLENGRLEGIQRSQAMELAELRDKLDQQESVHAAQKVELRRQFDQELLLVQTRLKDREAKVTELLHQQSRDAEAYSKLQRSIHLKSQQVRQESSTELERAQREADQKHEEIVNLTSSLRAAVAECEDVKRSVALLQQQLAQSEKARHATQLQVEEAKQAAMWAQAERDRSAIQVAQLQQQLDSANVQSDSLQTATMEAERSKIQLQYAYAEIEEHKRMIESERFKFGAVRKALEAKVLSLVKELKETQKEYKLSLARLEKHKKKLITAVIEKDHELAAMHVAPLVGGTTSAAFSRTVGHGASPEAGSPRGASTSASAFSLDPLVMLRAQAEAANQTQQALRALTEPSTARSPKVEG